MNIVRLKRVGKWLLAKLVDTIVHLVDLLPRFLHSREWSPRLKVIKKRQT